jgi:hypothetical protein
MIKRNNKMSSTVSNAIDKLSNIVNLATGLVHPNDLNKAKELFLILHQNGEILLKNQIVGFALAKGWSAEDADELGSLAQQIGEGKAANVAGGPWWKEDIYTTLSS